MVADLPCMFFIMLMGACHQTRQIIIHSHMHQTIRSFWTNALSAQPANPVRQQGSFLSGKSSTSARSVLQKPAYDGAQKSKDVPGEAFIKKHPLTPPVLKQDCT
ncbi:hypothetical protein [Komagataeibacter xylinus]|uniref:Uncharacterized protein n=1 Tax=Komagataeibacter xylinus TaxID=28448 RepID=A0A857FMT4_KOMXY|nr:hypothetical protein [Komagataeibacter xylinus]QHC35598.1 hypothetical protein FMA36_08985 [Komagataeibacter xylinus]